MRSTSPLLPLTPSANSAFGWEEVRMDGSSPWASADDDSPLPLPLPRPPSPLPSFGAASSPIAGGGGWGDDGGWGAAVDDYSTTTSSAFGTSSNAVGFEETTEDLDEPVQPAIASPVGSYGGGWGTTTSPPRPSLDLPPRSPPLDPSSSAATSNPRAPSPPGFAPSSPPASPPASAGTAAAAEDTSAESEEGAGGWGGHGSPDLPPIATLKLAESPTETRSKGWGGEDEWQPPEIPAPLPSFGDAFGGVKEDQDQEEGGWGGGGQAAPSWSLPGQEEGVQDEEGEQSWNDEASQGVRRGKSIVSPRASLGDRRRRKLTALWSACCSRRWSQGRIAAICAIDMACLARELGSRGFPRADERRVSFLSIEPPTSRHLLIALSNLQISPHQSHGTPHTPSTFPDLFTTTHHERHPPTLPLQAHADSLPQVSNRPDSNCRTISRDAQRHQLDRLPQRPLWRSSAKPERRYPPAPAEPWRARSRRRRIRS